MKLKANTNTYRSRFGLETPRGIEVELKYLEGLRHYLCWPDCTDGENIVQGWFNTKSEAKKYARQNGYFVKKRL